MSDAFMVAICGGEKCIEKAKSAYFKQVTGGPNYLRLLASVSGKNLWDVVYNADIEQWKEVMAVICTYADEKDFSDLCEALGDRIEEAGDLGDASFCYLAGSKLEKVVSIWLNDLSKNEKASIEHADDDSSYYSIHANALQTFIEKVTIFRKVTEFQDNERDAPDDWKLASLYDKYAEYADILASQGHLKTAERYLDLLPSKYPAADVARNRVRQATRVVATVSDQKNATQTTTRGQRVVQTFQPAQVSSIPTPNAMSNAYNPGPAFTPAGSQAPSSYNPGGGRSAYTPMGYQAPQQGYQTQNQGYQAPQQSQAYQPPSAAIPAAQPFAAPAYNQFGGVAPPPRATTQSPAITPAARQSSIPAWNDTPDVGPRAIPRRGTPSVVHPPANSGYAGYPSAVAPPTPYGAPPKSATPVPPPPKPGVGRTLSPANTASAPVSIDQRSASAAANTYSPPPSTISSMAPPVQRGASPYNPPPSAGPPSNRYAPAPGAQPTAPSASQPGPPSQRPISTPYAPQAGGYGPGPTPVAAAPIPTPGPPRGPPPKASGPSRIQPPPPPATGTRIANSLPSPQPSTSRPPSSGSAQASPAPPKYRK
jgi:protein transport protein SEC31